LSDAFARGSVALWEETAPGIRRQILSHDDDLMLVRVDFQAGAVGTMHQHPHRQATYVAAGRFEFVVNGETRTLDAGDSVFIAADLVHGVRALDAGTLIDAFTPARLDFLAAS
jgi:quercetin dioxygenase-like cupin family protein